MKKMISKFRELPISGRIQLIAAILMTLGLLTAIPVYAWFISQKKAAEMYKVEFPNALYVNAAHREDQSFFSLDGININEYALDPITGEPIKDNNGKDVKVDKFRYVFSVSGSNTNYFTLQLAHTNNNLFTYTIYPVTKVVGNEDDLYRKNESGQYIDENGVVVSADNKVLKAEYNKNYIVKYTQHSNSHTENTLKVVGDDYVDDDTSDQYYIMNSTPLDGRYINMNGSISSGALAKNNNIYFTKTYGTYSRVQANSVPSYWQIPGVAADPDLNKVFCKYYVLEVTWNDEQQKTQTKKETDMVYISAKRES